VGNRIIDALLSEFCVRQGIDSGNRAGALEQLGALCLLHGVRFDRGSFLDALTDSGEEGLDAVAVIVNGVLVTDPFRVTEIAGAAPTLNVDYVFMQTTLSSRWDSGHVLKFTHSTGEFFGEADIGTSKVVAAARRSHREIMNNVAKLERNPTLRVCYVGAGKEKHAILVKKRLAALEARLAQLELFSSIRCEVVDAERLRRLYRIATSAGISVVDLDPKMRLPIEGAERAFSGILTHEDLMRLIVDENGTELRGSVFEGNAGGSQSLNPRVHRRIREILVGPRSSQFALLDQGVTIVARELRVFGNTLKLTDCRIVAGAQTSQAIFACRDDLPAGKQILVPARIVQTEDEDLIAEMATGLRGEAEIDADGGSDRVLARKNVAKFFARRTRADGALGAFAVTLLGILGLGIALGLVTPSARGAEGDPQFVFTPSAQLPPPASFLNGPCGLAVDSQGAFYLADYYHDTVDVYTGSRGFLTQLSVPDPANGPCGLAVDSKGRLYVADYHGGVKRYVPSHFPVELGTAYGAGTTIYSGPTTGIAVDPASDELYVNERTAVAVYDSAGNPVETIGAGNLVDGYGVAVASESGAGGPFVYVADAADGKVKEYNVSKGTGKEIDAGTLTSLRDAAVAIKSDNSGGYVLDLLNPEHTEQPRGVVHGFGTVGGDHLKYAVVHGEPSGLAVDSSSASTKGRVYVTSGNGHEGTVYAYEKESATSTGSPLAPSAPPPAPGGNLLDPRTSIGRAAEGGSGIACTGDSCQVLPPAPVDPTLTTRLLGLGNPKVHYHRYHGSRRNCRRPRHCRRANRRARIASAVGEGGAGGGNGAGSAAAPAVAATGPQAQVNPLSPPSAGFDAHVWEDGGEAATEAGSHPYELELALGLGAEDLRSLRLDLSPGLLLDPAATSLCSGADFATARVSPFEASLSGESCPDRSQVGTLEASTGNGGGETRRFGLFNLNPGQAALQLGAAPFGVPLRFDVLVGSGPNGTNYALRLVGVPQSAKLRGLSLDLWGAPWDASHNDERGDCLSETEPTFPWCRSSVGEPLLNKPLALLTLPTECGQALALSARADSWQRTGALNATAVNRDSGGEPAPMKDCDTLGFESEPDGFLTVKKASSSSGFVFRLANGNSGLANPRSRINSPVKQAVVELPRGVTINPSVGAGLGVCTQAQLAAESGTAPPNAGCPNSSKIGDFDIRSPFYIGTLEGSIHLAAPHDNPFGSLIAIYLIAKSADRDILITAAGKLTPNLGDGTLTAVFDDLPQLPYSELEVNFRSGQRAPLVSPPACGAARTGIQLTPWSGGVAHSSSTNSEIATGIDGGPCPAGTPPFAPRAIAGGVNANVNSYTPYFVHLTRADTEQEITSYSLVLPKGITGKLAGIPFCADGAIAAARANGGFAEAARPSCPAASQVGRTLTGYGVGPALTYAEGRIYLAGPYHGSPLSLVTVNPATVGPFDLGTVVIRSAFDVDPLTAQLRIDSHASDPIPHIIDGIPLHLRDVRVYMDRHEFTHNPSSCEAARLVSTLTGSGASFENVGDDSSAQIEEHFQLLNCLDLGFRPKLGLRLRGLARRGAFPALRATFAARGPRDSNLKRIEVDMPHQLFLAQNHIRTVCTRTQFAAERCPSGSVYGKAVAYTPLLDEPLRGDVYLRSSDNKLPDLVTSLRSGEIRIDLVGRIGPSKDGGIQAFFDNLPDAPIKRFTMLLRGGRHGLLTNSVNVCKRPPRASVKALAQNNIGAIFTSELRGQCDGKGREGKGRH